MHNVWKSHLRKNKFYWSVKKANDPECVLALGYTDTYDQAERNARNFIKNNQNAVYG